MSRLNMHIKGFALSGCPLKVTVALRKFLLKFATQLNPFLFFVSFGLSASLHNNDYIAEA